MNRKEQEIKLKENIILQAAEEIFTTKGYSKANLTSIAKKANYSKASLYSYFQNKDEICLAVLNRLLEGIFQIFEKQISLETLIESFIEYQKKHPFAQEIIHRFRMNSGSCVVSDKISQKNLTLNKKIRKAIEDIVIMSRANTDKNNLIRPNLIAYILWGNLDGILPGLMKFSKTSTEKFTNKEITENIIKILTKGIV